MMQPTTIQHLGQARLAELHHQAQRDALARAAHQARRTRRQPGGHRPVLLAVVTRWARRLGSARGARGAAPQAPRPAVTTRQDATARTDLADARCKALFASGLQRSDAPSSDMIAGHQELRAAVRHP
jgi:hypothetical protein